MENIKLSNIVVNFFNYYENKFRDNIEILPIEKNYVSYMMKKL